MALITVSNNSLTAVTALPASVPTGALTLIKSITASSSASISFVDGASDVVFDDTYKSYVFKFINIHPATASVFQVNFRDGGTDYDATKTTTYFRARHFENGTSGALGYLTGYDEAQSTGVQDLALDLGADNDQSCSGELTIFNPSSTTFVKHFIATVQEAVADDQTRQNFVAGYCNVTAAIDGVQFSMSSGNIDSGIIKLYGVL
tara:strand:+ start:497 stop:1111 length:615 start_codon:yes stop_codon:yes gene_type:complete